MFTQSNARVKTTKRIPRAPSRTLLELFAYHCQWYKNIGNQYLYRKHYSKYGRA